MKKNSEKKNILHEKKKDPKDLEVIFHNIDDLDAEISNKIYDILFNEIISIKK